MSSRISMISPLWGEGAFTPSDPDYVLTREEWGNGALPPEGNGNTIYNNHNIHASSRDDTSGCALAIAYKSDAKDVQPEDFVIFTVVHDCPKRQRETVAIPNLPACPNDQCICAWTWIPKNSGDKNFYMTPFVCKVTGARADASPVDTALAIPPRRCLDGRNCAFGPRQPLYWLGAGHEINMPENQKQSPHYSIIYGFREGAQNDIFVNTNPRRHVVKEILPEQTCNGEKSRVAEGATWTNLTSPDCGCRAVRNADGGVHIFDPSNNRVSTINTIGGNFGPRDVVGHADFKAGKDYFALSKRPYTMDLDDRCYLYVTDSDGFVVWESMYDKRFIDEQFTGESPDPSVWPHDGVVYDGDGNGPPPMMPPPPSSDNTLFKYAYMRVGESLWSGNNYFQLVLQHDGNLVGYDHRHSPPSVFWSSGTAGEGHGDAFLSVQGDGDVVLYSLVGWTRPVWSSGTRKIVDGLV